jgi:signal peptidase I
MPRTRGLLLPVAALIGLVAGLRGLPVGRYIVEGPSMEPAYRPGDRVLVNRLAYLRRPPAVGDVVVLRDPERQGHFLLKRVAQAPDHPEPGPARFYVLGDNAAASRDSRVFGPVARRQIVGKAWLRY